MAGPALLTTVMLCASGYSQRGKLYDVRELAGGFELVRQRVDVDRDATPLPPSAAPGSGRR